MKKTNVAFKSILSYQNKAITQLCLNIDQQALIVRQVKAVLPTGLADHVVHCVLNGKKLLVYTDSANWASQLRFYGESVQTAIAPLSPAAEIKMQVKVNNPLVVADTHRNRKANIPSQTVVNGILKQSQYITDPQLKQAFAKLGKTLSRLQTNSL